MTSSLTHDDQTRYCHNCGAAVDYHYCAVCGQETKLHVPSAGEFIHEFIGHYVALEGRLWKTLAGLLFRPGFLSAEYIAGRRVRYVEPLRVYLSFSILFFALLKLIGPPVVQVDAADTRALAAVHAAEVRRQSLAESRLERGPGAAVVDFSPTVGAKINTFMAKQPNEQIKALAAGFFAYVPYAMFGLMPLFALYLKLLYLGSGRRYGEHLLFALHSNAFAFAMFGLMILCGSAGWDVAVFLLGLWLLCYLPAAMRRVYGGGRWSTGLRWIVLMTAHMLSMLAAILTAFSLAVLG